MPRPAIFLDRDGVLNVGFHGDYIRDVSQFQWLAGARDGVAALSRAGWPIVVVTNQSGVARGLYTLEDVESIHSRMLADLAADGGAVEAVYVCPHRPEDACDCRKPLPGMLLRAARELGLDLPRSVFIGDAETDMSAGRAAGCRVLAVTTGLATPDEIAQWMPAPERVFDTLTEAAEWINAHGMDRS